MVIKGPKQNTGYRTVWIKNIFALQMLNSIRSNSVKLLSRNRLH